MQIRVERIYRAQHLIIVKEYRDDGTSEVHHTLTGPRAEKIAGMHARSLGKRLGCSVIIDGAEHTSS